MPSFIRRWMAAIVCVMTMSAIIVPAASADKVYHTDRLELLPVGSAPLKSGFVVNIHMNGPQVYAHEIYSLKGAMPNTTYQVMLLVYVGDTTCSAAPAATIQTAELTTNAAGNGTSDAWFDTATVTATGLRGLTVGGQWQILLGDQVVYETGCEVITLD